MFNESWIENDPQTPEVERSPVVPRRREPSLDRLFLNRRGALSWDQMIGFRDGQRRKGHQLIFWSWLAIAIDGLMVTSLSSIGLMLVVLVMQDHLHAGTRTMFGAVFLFSTWTYLIVSRIFFSQSLGEWACDLRLGQPTQRHHMGYPVKVILRATLVLLTGIVTMPILSLITGRDIAGHISGLKITSLN